MSTAIGDAVKERYHRWLAGREDFRQILLNSAWLYFDRFMRLIAGLIITPWIARYLGPEEFGLLNYAMAIVVLFSAIATLGLDSFVVRKFVEKPGENNVIIGTVFFLKLGGGLLALAMAWATILILHENDPRLQLLVLIIATGTVCQCMDVIAYWNQSQMQQKMTVIAKNGAFVILSLAKIIFILVNAPLEAFAIAASIEILLGGVALFVLYRYQQKQQLNWKFDSQIALGLLKVSWPLIFSSLAISIYMRIDQIMLGKMVGEHAVGIYSAALRLSELWYVIPTVIVSASLPVLLRIKQESDEQFMQRLQRISSLMVKIAYLVAIPLTFMADDIVNLFFGASYQGAGAVLAVHIWSAVFVFLGVVMSTWTTAYGFTKYALIQTVTGAIINIGLNWVLIPHYGAVGAAWATVISYGIAVYGINLVWKPARPMFRLQTRSLLLK